MLIAVEGISKVGKTTQIELLKQKLIPGGWRFYREPGSTPFGENVREAVQGRHDYEVDKYAAIFAYMAARANLIRGIVKPAVDSGAKVLLDRYWYSSYAYQGAEGVSKLFIGLVANIATAGLKPNLVIQYDMDFGEACRRSGNKSDVDRYDEKGERFMSKVRKNYRELSFLYSGIWRTIDASGSVDEVHKTTMRVIQEKLGNV